MTPQPPAMHKVNHRHKTRSHRVVKSKNRIKAKIVKIILAGILKIFHKMQTIPQS